MALKGFIFDFNGTLFQDTSYHVGVFSGMLREAGKPVPAPHDMVRMAFGMSNEAICRAFFNPNATDAECQAFSHEKETRYINACKNDNPRLVDGAVEMLDYLKANGIPFGLATGSPLQNIIFYREIFDLGRWFDESNIVYADGTLRCKPAPDFYLKAAEKIGLKPQECVVFEDGLQGMLSAQSAGVKTRIALYEEGQPSPLNDKVDALVTLHDLKDWKRLVSDLIER